MSWLSEQADMIRTARKHGFTVQEGRKHTKVWNPDRTAFYVVHRGAGRKPDHGPHKARFAKWLRDNGCPDC